MEPGTTTVDLSSLPSFRIQQMHYAARIHSDGIGCARWSATSFLRRACCSALIEAGSSRNAGPIAIAFLKGGRSPISSSQRFTFGDSSISIFRVAQLDAQEEHIVAPAV